MHVGFLGFGLIGGSIARAVRANPSTAAWTMAAWSPSGHGPTSAAADRTIDVAAPSPVDATADADLVVLAAPATTCLMLLNRLAGPWASSLRPATVITDVASSKAQLVDRAETLGLRFVGGHPMAGREDTGYAASTDDLFVDRPWVLTPSTMTDREDTERVAVLVRACGSTVIEMDPAVHDRAVAGISHLPMIVAAALAEAVAIGSGGSPGGDWPVAAGLAAGGWRDTTRVARGDPAMGAAIAVTNADALAERLRDLQAVLETWILALERPGGPDEAAIEARLSAARAALGDRG
ncbi:MAG: prephenate dehydrogenase/arogenate dehydrogenase family protein [Chloroflexi bacterium]|nr:prephenate dehydrogenase/arogenate dehydrogenase family protein [Chloroflexota bacterium]